jgi:hypothetical protein
MPNHLTHPAVKLGKLIQSKFRDNKFEAYRKLVSSIARNELIKLMLGLPNNLSSEQIALVLKVARVHPEDYTPLLIEMQNSSKLSIDALYHAQEVSVAVRFKDFDYEINIDDDLKAELISKIRL